jgi:hypothetical protein
MATDIGWLDGRLMSGPARESQALGVWLSYAPEGTSSQHLDQGKFSTTTGLDAPAAASNPGRSRTQPGRVGEMSIDDHRGDLDALAPSLFEVRRPNASRSSASALGFIGLQLLESERIT